MKNSLTRKIEKDIKMFYPDCYVDVEEVRNGDGERSVSIFMNRPYELGLFEEAELGGLKAVVFKRTGSVHNLYLLNEGGNRNATVNTIAEILI